jgi:hypothetical protein
MAWKYAVNHLELAILIAVGSVPGCTGAEIVRAIAHATERQDFRELDPYRIIGRLAMGRYITRKITGSCFLLYITPKGQTRMDLLLSEIDGGSHMVVGSRR